MVACDGLVIARSLVWLLDKNFPASFAPPYVPLSPKDVTMSPCYVVLCPYNWAVFALSAARVFEMEMSIVSLGRQSCEKALLTICGFAFFVCIAYLH